MKKNNFQQVKDVLSQWELNTRKGEHDKILVHHHPDAVIYDVLPPLKYDNTKAYKENWDEWQPQTKTGELDVFELYDLTIEVGESHSFAYGLLHCGGTLPNDKKFEDRVRITFCLVKKDNHWQIVHQHTSKTF